jgi:hypothetical protein
MAFSARFLLRVELIPFIGASNTWVILGRLGSRPVPKVLVRLTESFVEWSQGASPRGGDDPRVVTELADGNQERQLERTKKA